ncbi:MAG TPA: glucose 1-dehydrogenase [Vicinamibacterales bacterium]|nr:glucose 1-dehydrogenase [Vicinamibacterales bacterium]
MSASPKRLAGKTAIVTGSSRGIGRGIATRFAQEGANVVINYVGALGAAEEALAEVVAAGGRGVLLQADVSSVPEVNGLVEAAVREFGTVDILVNNAGVETHAPFWEVTETDYDRVMNVNVKGAFFAAQALTRHLRATERPGRIINISSVHEDMAFPNFAAYCASKGALRMLARTLAVELGPLGITINNIAPGAIETPINTALLNDPAKLGSLLRQIPLGRLGQPGDVAGLAAFLASDDASYVTGSTFVVDGGLSVFYEEQ